MRVFTITVAAAALALAACSSSTTSDTTTESATQSAATDSASSTTPGSSTTEGSTVRVLTHDSFALSESVIEEFTANTGITVAFIPAGDAGEMVNRAVLSVGAPEADVLYGVDTTLLTRAVDAGVFAPYTSADAGSLRPELADLGGGVVTPIDDGDVCINVDDVWFADNGIAPPTTLDDLLDPAYRSLLVVENPATSSPGLAFLLGTIARYQAGGEGATESWTDYWTALRDNDVLVVNGWSEAYYTEFTGGGGGGDRPLVVSYSTSPPAEIIYAEGTPPDQPSTSTMLDSCYRQVEFAGVLAGTEQPEAAQRVIDWLISPQVQADVPLSMFVFPARADTPLPDAFAEFVTRPQTPLELPADVIAAERDRWIEEWTQIVLR